MIQFQEKCHNRHKLACLGRPQRKNILILMLALMVRSVYELILVQYLFRKTPLWAKHVVFYMMLFPEKNADDYPVQQT